MNDIPASCLLPSRLHGRRGLFGAALVCLCLLPSFVAAQAPDGPEPPRGKGPVEFMQSSVENYRDELEAMKAEYMSRGKSDLPDQVELLLSGGGLKRGRILTVAVTREADSDPLEDLGPPKTTDKNCRFYLTDLTFEGGGDMVDDKGNAIVGRRLAADRLSAEALNLPLTERLALSGSWVAVTKQPCTMADGSTQWGDALVPSLAGRCRDIRSRFKGSVHLRSSGGLYLAGPRRVASRTPGKATLTLVARDAFEGMEPGEKDKDGKWIKPPKAKIAAEKEFGTRTYQTYAVLRAGLFGEDLDYLTEPALPPAPMAVYFLRANPLLRTEWAIGRSVGIVVSDGEKEEVRGLVSTSLARPIVESGRTFELRPTANAYYVGGEGETTFYVQVGSSAHGRVLETPRHTLTAAGLGMTIKPEPLNGYQLIAGQNYTVHLVHGQAAPKDEKTFVRWKEISLEGIRVAGSWGKTIRSFVSRLAFARDALGTWQAEDFKSGRPVRRVRFTPAAEFVPERGPGFTIEYPRPLELFRPGLKKVQLFARRPLEEWREAPAQLDLFTTTAGGSREIEFSANLTFADDTVVQHVAPGSLGWAHLRTEGAYKLFQEIKDTVWTRYAIGQAPMEGAEATFSLSVSPLSASRGVLLENPDSPPTAPSVKVTLNRLVWTSEAESSGQTIRHRLMAFGPADMSGCGAQWRTQSPDGDRVGGVGTRFVPSGAGQAVATLDMPLAGGAQALRVTHVSALDRGGNVLALLQADTQVDAAIRIQLDFPSTATGDQKLVVRAMIEGLPLDLASRAYCRWSVTPNVGAFEATRTPIAVSTQGRAASIAVLTFDPTKTQVGMKPKIAVDLVLGD